MRIPGWLVCVIMLLKPLLVGAQPPAEGLKFEVISIKPSAPDQQNTSMSVQPGGTFRMENGSVLQLIAMSYSLRDFQIAGAPGWAGAERFDITATASAEGGSRLDPRSMTEEQRAQYDRVFKARIRDLLAERFGLAAREETREMPVYALVVAKGGSKLKPNVAEGAGNRGIQGRRGSLNGMRAPVRMLAEFLSNTVSKPVIDRTGLEGNFDWKLEWAPDQPAAAPGDAPAADSSGPSLFTALQEQLGLKLESTRAPAPVLVIERLEKPSAN